jgi:hypothetical protein
VWINIATAVDVCEQLTAIDFALVVAAALRPAILTRFLYTRQTTSKNTFNNSNKQTNKQQLLLTGSIVERHRCSGRCGWC